MPDRTGHVANPKASMVSRGFRQVHGKEYCKTFVPRVKLTSIPSILEIVTLLIVSYFEWIWLLHLNGELDDDVYSNVPQGETGTDREFRESATSTLAQALYGLNMGTW